MPVIVRVVNGLAMVGATEVIVGGPGVDCTVNGVELVALPLGLVTVIGPEVAPLGTIARSTVGLALSTFPLVPLNETT